MKILTAENIGFCFGVRKALETIHSLLRTGRKTYMFGQLVHNPGVIESLRTLGAEIVESLDRIPRDSKESFLVIRAHGIDPQKKEKLKRHFFEVVDTTCPIVGKLFSTVQRAKREGYRIVVFGKVDHPEMEALKGYVEDAVVSESPVKPDRKTAFASQTTMSISEYSTFLQQILQKYFEHVKEMKIFNTICEATAKREREVERLAKENNLVIVVGGKNSSNTAKLARIASRFTRSVQIESERELKKDFVNYDKIAVVAGTSTPKSDVEKVSNKLQILCQEGR
ncbi:MAG: 4-hydroxy-3-methylbut-2-enyl diphosphate reductase [Thermotogae bacterium]|nr:MAG: 4-hydroxy-3-methylbut-2-enyl diphosphate reductase [Thermotogota bacterium]